MTKLEIKTLKIVSDKLRNCNFLDMYSYIKKQLLNEGIEENKLNNLYDILANSKKYIQEDINNSKSFIDTIIEDNDKK